MIPDGVEDEEAEGGQERLEIEQRRSGPMYGVLGVKWPNAG